MTDTILSETFACSLYNLIFLIVDVKRKFKYVGRVYSKSAYRTAKRAWTSLPLEIRDITVLTDYGSLTYTPMQNRISSLPRNAVKPKASGRLPFKEVLPVPGEDEDFARSSRPSIGTHASLS